MSGDSRKFEKNILKIYLAEHTRLILVLSKTVEILGHTHNLGLGHIKKERLGLSCQVCGHKFDYYKAGCPRCIKLEHQRYTEIDLRNKHLEKLVELFIGDEI